MALIHITGGKVDQADILLACSHGEDGEEGGSIGGGVDGLFFLFNRRTLGSGAEPQPISYDLNDIVLPDRRRVERGLLGGQEVLSASKSSAW